MEEHSVLIWIAAAAGIAVAAGLGVWIRNRVRQVADIISTVKNAQLDLLAEKPRSVSGMTSIYLPQIERDFPGFNYPVLRQKAENTLRELLLSLDSGRAAELDDASPELREQVRLRIEDNHAAGREEHYRDIILHQTEIARYEKREGRCIITLQSAVGYRYYVLEGDRVTDGTRERDTQTKYNLELHYVQDVSQLAESFSTAIGVTCPNCGAPVSALGDKKCAYCGSGIIPVEDRVWKINRYERIC